MQRLSLNLSALMYGATAAILLSLLDGLRSDLYIYKNISRAHIKSDLSISH
jgi:hypothetical protein